MAHVSRIGRGGACALAALTVLGLSCAGPRTTEPDVGGPAFARADGGDPTVNSADPSGAPQNSTLDIHVFGTNYDQGSKVDFTRAGVVEPKLHVNATAYLSTTELVANVSIAADAAPVSYDVMVTKSTGKKGIGTEKFAVLVPVEVLSAPSGFSFVEGMSENGLVAGSSPPPRWATGCWPGRHLPGPRWADWSLRCPSRTGPSGSARRWPFYRAPVLVTPRMPTTPASW